MAKSTGNVSAAPPAFGALEGVYGRAPLWARLEFWLVVGCLAFGILAFVVPTQGGGNTGKIVGVVLMLVAVGGGAWIAMNLKRRVALYANGVRILDGDKLLFSALWPEVAFIEEQREGTSEDDFCGITLHSRKNHKYRIFQTYKNFHFLKQTICSRVYDVVRAATMAAFERGEAVNFKGLKLRSEGVEDGGRIVPWDKIGVSYGQVEMIVSELPKNRKIWSLPVGLIPNFTIVLEIFNSAGIET